MKLWAKEGIEVANKVEAFTVGADRELDVLLARCDVLGSKAHVAMLESVGLLTKEEMRSLTRGLNGILGEIEEGTFTIDMECEDVHSYIEMVLTERLGPTGKKIHSGRSRNDQVATAMKLYLKEEAVFIKDKLLQLFQLLQELSEKHKDQLMPGYTHLQVAMPSSFGLWFGAYAESLVDDMELLVAAKSIIDKNPLGSGAGYGSSFPLNRRMTTDLLGFNTLSYNSIYAQMSRGKSERAIGVAMAAIANTVSRLSMDVCLFNSQNFGFVSFPNELTTGSSIMPHKRNPDVFELIRAKCNRIQAVPNELTLLTSNLPSGYHRDCQLSKGILFPAISELKDCVEMAVLMLGNISVHERLLDEERYKYVFTVEGVHKLVQQGVPFREAYQQVAREVEDGSFTCRPQSLDHVHEGSIGNLCNEEVRRELERVLGKW